jgi:hypothetical protein
VLRGVYKSGFPVSQAKEIIETSMASIEGGCIYQHEFNHDSLIRHLKEWSFPTSLEYNTDLVLASHPWSFDGFIVLLPDGGSAQADKGALHYVEVRGKGKH